MTDDTQDRYPTPEELRTIREWPANRYEDLMDLVRSIWWHEELIQVFGNYNDARRYDLHTGGWSGNEDIVDALQHNTLFWSVCWKSTKAGGHYRLNIPMFVLQPSIGSRKCKKKEG